MKVTVRVYGPDLTTFFERRQVVDVAARSTVDDLVRHLETNMRSIRGWSLNLLELTILVNGKNAEILKDRTLKEGGEITIISPYRGG